VVGADSLLHVSQAALAADVTYLTGYQLAFTYLQDNITKRKEMVVRGGGAARGVTASVWCGSRSPGASRTHTLAGHRAATPLPFTVTVRCACCARSASRAPSTTP
jgi:hypothetical protein